MSHVAATPVLADADDLPLQHVVERLSRRFTDRGVHRDVIEAAVLSGWARYDEARIQTFRLILAERAATTALQRWFGEPTPLRP